MDTQIERIPGEPDEAARALAMWASGLSIDQIATRLRRQRVKILAYKQEWKWDERTERGSAKPVVQPRTEPSAAQAFAGVEFDQRAAELRKPASYSDEIAATIARIERSQEGLKALQHAQFALGLKIIKKLGHAVDRLDDTAVKPRDIGPLLAAATRATDSAWNNLANIEGVNAFLEAAIKTQNTPTQEPDEDDD
jgi:hypothetical protein